MKIIGVETVHVAEFSNLVWVRLHTESGLIGLGETFRNPRATIAYVHETCAPALIGRDARARAALERDIRDKVGNHFSGYPTRSVEVRGNSAVDMALWDLAGKSLGVPLYQLLGGRSRDTIRIYNTCASSDYNAVARQNYNTRLEERGERPAEPIASGDDLMLQVHEPARLACELLDAGITGMKIWPFDVAALRNNGDQISAAELESALWPVKEIRREVGDAMDVMIEFHALWRLPAAIKIARARWPTTASIGWRSRSAGTTSPTWRSIGAMRAPMSPRARTWGRSPGIATHSRVRPSTLRISTSPGSAG